MFGKKAKQLAQRVLPPPIMKSDPGNKQLETLFPGWAGVDSREKVMVGLPTSGAAYFSGVSGAYAPDEQWGQLGLVNAAEEVPFKRVLPEDRGARYAILRFMAQDPTIDSAIKMHISNALSTTSNTAQSVFIREREYGKTDKIVAELRAVLMPIIERNLSEWARKAAVYGACFARIYGRRGVGLENVRCDYYTHPARVQKFEKAGRLAGFTTTFQNTSVHSHHLQLLPPWTFVGFEIPEWEDYEYQEPINVSGNPVDLAVDDPAFEGLVESQEYGTSLIATAYGPWMDLLDAVCSLKMSRRNAARLERIIGVNTGRLDPRRASQYLQEIATRILNASNDVQNQSYLRGKVQTVINHLIPNFAEKGSIQVDTVQGTPDINGVEDVLFHIKRLGSAIGVDPALLGFGDFLSGGMGDGGFFRISLMAATKADMLRRAIKNGVERLCEIHVALKYGKVFLPDDKPWEIGFNALSTAIEREERETMEASANLAGSLAGVFATVDQDFSTIDKRELCRVFWKKINLNDEDFERVFPKEKAKIVDQSIASQGDMEQE